MEPLDFEEGRLPNLLIVGAQKSGTTWLHSCLRKSEHVFGSETKELNFFNKAHYRKKLPEYKQNFIETPGVQYYMESTPHYFRLPGPNGDTASKIKDLLGSPKLIALMRNPVDRFESAVTHHMMRGRLPYRAVIDQPIDQFGALAFGRYGEILRHWRAQHPDIGVFFYDDIVEKPVRFVREVMRFLDLECDISPGEMRFRTNDKTQKIGRVERTLDWDQLPECTPALRAELRDYFRADIEDLQSLTGRDLSHWLADQ